ncbi:MAG: DUF4352 domain-containing protein [Acidobacteriota bacterium]
MGERVQVGPLIYTVLEGEWRDQLGAPPNLRTPQHRFLILRLSVTNSGARESSIPPLTLIGPGDQSYPELTNGEGVEQWLGYLRSLSAAGTEHARVLFDVPSGSYRLRVVNEAEPEEERAALIDIPFQAPPAPPELPIRPPGQQPK